jgi:hypothetical protein
LKFNQSFEKESIGGFAIMQQIGVMARGVGMSREATLLGRFVAKLVVDVLPAALASLIGAFLYTQYQFGHTAAQLAATQQAAPASAEMMQLVRDEHAMIVDYLKAQAAAEKSRYAAEDKDDARAVADAKTATVTAPTTTARRLAAADVAPPPVALHIKAPVIVSAPAPRVPLVIAQAQNIGGTPVATAPPQSDSLLAKTLDIKDHVVHATLHAVSAIGGIPNWIASIGDHIGGGDTASPAQAQQFSSAS